MADDSENDFFFARNKLREDLRCFLELQNIAKNKQLDQDSLKANSV